MIPRVYFVPDAYREPTFVSSNALTILAGVDLPAHNAERLTAAFPEHRFVFASHDDVFDQLGIADVVLAWGLPPARTAEATNLKWLQTVSAGVDRIDHAELKRRGILVTNSSGIHAINIAEHVLSMMFSFARRLPDFLDSQRQELWNEFNRPTVNVGPPAFELTGQTLFVVGMGRIGEALAKRAKALDMNVVGTVRRSGKVRSEHVDDVILQSELASRIGEADHVAICLPLTNETRGLFDAAMLSSMKDGSLIYNIGRGPIIDQNALYAELQSGRLGGAGLDVTDPEPLPAGNELWKLGNVIITPHVSGYSPKLWDRGVELWIENIRRFTNGDELLNLVDLDAQY